MLEVLKMSKTKKLNILYLILFLIYVSVGTLVLVYSNDSREKNNVILGILILLSTLPHLILFIAQGGFKNERKYPFLMFFAIGVTIGLVTIFKSSIELNKVCVIWGCFDICRSSYEICDVIPELKEHKWLELVEFLLSSGEIVIAILLIIDEFEGIKLHLIYFGIVFIVSAIKRIADNILKSINNEKSVDHN